MVFETAHDSTAFIYNSNGLLTEVEYYDGVYNFNTNKYTYELADKSMSFTYNNGLLTVIRDNDIVSMKEQNKIDSLFYDSQNRI